MAEKQDSGFKTVGSNRKAFHDYSIEEKIEAGLILKGTEVKSLREGRVNLREGYATVAQGKSILHNVHIGEYSHGNIMNHEPLRPRPLLLHKKQIEKLTGKVQQKGLTIVPLRIYFNPRGIAKVELGLARGKKNYDRRETIKKREAGREMERALKSRQRD
ncbi:SsrA-binding protein SmpB [Candidatus Nitronereus thalassa]|uniref:SsrA-binding protein n=1 Tax=Candidatus Nitronereus thalassa TaxID=3020898 RepID=A0ABU3K8W1_9BACT|nr:SsrA-binding protein SmpB [Candidatus Nitronereus thalassa]MDT7042884.1 SsrA-binding protein SmpB [Candidatus Nitronereus thalassa]